jgi:hypothetical protein
MLPYLRARSATKGFLGGSRGWVAIGLVVWTVRFFQWLTRPETGVIYRDRIQPGQNIQIVHLEAPPTRRERRKAKRAARR